MARERRAYIVLVLICIFLCGAVLTISVKNDEAKEKQLCIMLVIDKQYAPPKPEIPSHPTLFSQEQYTQQERVWLLHLARLKLAHKLGC